MTPIADGRSLGEAKHVDLARKVRLVLSANRRGFGRIRVSAEAGVVRISGSVHSFFMRQMAVALATQVAGVRGVVDDLEVDLQEIATPRVRHDG